MTTNPITAPDRESWYASPAERAGTDPITGPFTPSWQLVDYRDMPGYAIPPRELPGTGADDKEG